MLVEAGQDIWVYSDPIMSWLSGNSGVFHSSLGTCIAVTAELDCGLLEAPVIMQGILLLLVCTSGIFRYFIITIMVAIDFSCTATFRRQVIAEELCVW